MPTDSGRRKISDKKYDSSIKDTQLENILFERLVALKIEFSKINFRYCIFDSAYLRNCQFKECDFTGCKFVNCNLTGSSFCECTFDYSIFEKTFIDNDILYFGCPIFENLKLKFARTLRLNYQQIGDSKSVNKAMSIELQATKSHLYKAFKSNETYYRKKYIGINRFRAFCEYISFISLDFIWGNGESVIKLFRAVFILLLLITLTHPWLASDPKLIPSYFNAFMESPYIFFGELKPPEYPRGYLLFILIFRLIMFSFFMSVIIKKFNRR